MIDQDRLRKLLVIDKHSLDDAIIENPQLVLEVGDAHAEAVGYRDTLKERLAVIDAALDGEARTYFEKRKQKPTEASVKSYILLNRDHTIAFTNYIKAKMEADKLAALKAAYEDRREALRDLAKLYIANYFDHTSVQGTSAEDLTVYNTRRRIVEAARGHRTKK